MIHLKYKCKVDFVKLPLISIDLCLKLVFENATAGRKNRLPLGCELRESRDTHNACNANDKLSSWVRHPPAGSVRRGSHEGVYGN